MKLIMGKSTNNDPRGNARDRNLAKKAGKFRMYINSTMCIHPHFDTNKHTTVAAQAEIEREAAAAEERREAASWAIGVKCDKKALEASERDRKLKLKAERFNSCLLHCILYPTTSFLSFFLIIPTAISLETSS